MTQTVWCVSAEMRWDCVPCRVHRYALLDPNLTEERIKEIYEEVRPYWEFMANFLKCENLLARSPTLCRPAPRDRPPFLGR